MALTIEQAAEAGELARTASACQHAITALEQAVGAGAVLEQVTVVANLGAPLTSAVPLSPADTATLLGTAKTIYQGMLDTITAQLKAM